MSNTGSQAPSSKSGNYRAPSRSAPSHEETGDFEYMVETITESVKDYGSKHPIAVASVIFLSGFYLGWKIKPW